MRREFITAAVGMAAAVVMAAAVASASQAFAQDYFDFGAIKKMPVGVQPTFAQEEQKKPVPTPQPIPIPPRQDYPDFGAIKKLPVGVQPAFAQEEQKKPVPTPQPIPIPPRHEHEKECEERAHVLLPGAAARGCVERLTECPCPAPCGADARDRCGGGCAPREACDGDRYEPCRPAKRDYDEEKGAALPPYGGLKISAFALYAERRLRLGECDRIEGGDIGVRSFAEDAHESQLRIGDNATVDPRRLVAAPSVRIGDGVTLGLVDTDQFRDDGVPLGPPAVFPTAGMPPLPLVTKGGGGGPNVSVGHDQALALPPGHYGALRVEGV